MVKANSWCMNYKGFHLMEMKLKKDFHIYISTVVLEANILFRGYSLNSSHNPVKITTGCPLINKIIVKNYIYTE